MQIYSEAETQVKHTFVSTLKYSSSRNFFGFDSFDTSISESDISPDLEMIGKAIRFDLSYLKVRFKRETHLSLNFFKFSTNVLIRLIEGPRSS